MANILRKGFILIAKISKKFSRVKLDEWIDIELSKIKPGEKILCIGGGGGLDKRIKNIEGVETVVIDIDPYRKPDIVMDATKMQFEDDSFDAVFMMEVLEHVKLPDKALSEVYRVLRDGGSFVLSVPFVFGIHEEPYDYQRYTKYGLINILRDFSDLNIRERNGYYASIIVLFMRSIFSPGKKRQIIGGLLIILGFPFFLGLLLVDVFVSDERSTSGYFVFCKKNNRK